MADRSDEGKRQALPVLVHRADSYSGSLTLRAAAGVVSAWSGICWSENRNCAGSACAARAGDAVAGCVVGGGYCWSGL